MNPAPSRAASRRPSSHRGSGWLLLLVLAPGCEGRVGGPLAGAVDGADQVMIGATTTLTTDGSRNGYVTADSAFVDQGALRIDFRRIRVTLFALEGEQIATLAAPRGLYSVGAGTLEAGGGVVVVNARGDSLTTPSLTYDKAARQFRGDSAYTFRSRGGVRTGSGFTSDLGLANLRPGGPR